MRFGFPSFRRRGTALPGVPPTLYPLALSGYNLPENSAPGTIVGSIIGRTAGSDGGVLSVTAGSRFAISGGNIVAGATATDYEAAQSHSITITETLAGATGSPKATVLTINVVNQNDTNPNAFTLTDATNAALGTFVYASTTVAGLGASDSVTSSISGDASSRQRKNGGTWTAAAISGVVNGDVIDVGNTASAVNSTAVNTVLSIGTTSDTFTSTTIAAAGAITAPVLSNFTSGGTWDTSFPDATDTVGLRRRLQVCDAADFVTLRQDLYKPLTEQDIEGTNASSWASTDINPPRNYSTGVIEGLNLGTGTRNLRERLERDDGAVSAWSNTVSATQSNPLASTQWQLVYTANPQSGGPWYALADIYTRQTIGDGTSAVIATSAAGTAVSWNSTHVAANVLDNNGATDFYGDDIAHPLVLTFASAVYLPEIQIRATTADPFAAPSAAKWQRWDGAAWQDVITFNGAASGSWTAGELRTFH